MKKLAKFIDMNGLDYHEKIITYEELEGTTKILNVKNIQYCAEHISTTLSKAMQKEIVHQFRQIFKGQPFHIERTTFDCSNDTKQMIMIGNNSLVLKKGSFCDDKIIEMYQRYFSYYHNRLSSHDIVKEAMYEPLLTMYQKMMEEDKNQENLTDTYHMSSQDIYLQILYTLQELAGITNTKQYQKESKEKVLMKRSQ